MSTAKPMTTSDRQARYEKQNGGPALTARQAHRIRKTELRAEHGRHRKPKVGIGRGDVAVRGRKSSYTHWFRNAYKRWLRDARRTNPRAKLGRYTPSRNR
jgi:hypothetical protein